VDNSETHDDGNVPRPLIRAEDIARPADAAILLDVNLPHYDTGWFEAVGHLSGFRIPDFRKNFDGLVKAACADPECSRDTREEIVALFMKEAHAIALKLHGQAQTALENPALKPWSAADYGPQQLTHALQGKGMRFDKAVITALALNRVAEVCGHEIWSIRPHQIVACVFFAANLHSRIAKLALSHSGDEAKGWEMALQELSEVTGQSVGMLLHLAGTKPEDETDDGYEAAATTLASYPTLYAIHHAVHQLLRRRNEESGRNRPDKAIVRRRPQSHKMKIYKEEKVASGRVNHGPFAWLDEEGSDTAQWPKRIVVPAKDHDPEES
jgi:hypothetical protein